MGKLLSINHYSLYHYGSYEIDFLKRMFAKYGGCSQDEFDSIIGAAVNVLTFCHLNIYFPTHINGLKAIAGFLKFNWRSTEASGLQSIVWRQRWVESRDSELKQKLIDYNSDDCAALKLVVDTIADISANADSGGVSFARADKMKKTNQYRWGRNLFASADFSYVNQCAYFDYQRAKIYWRTDKTLRACLRSIAP